MTDTTRIPTDAERLNPANVRPWVCTAALTMVIVLATCPGEAKGAAAYWLERAGIQFAPGHRLSEIHAREATLEDVERWRGLRSQTKASAEHQPKETT